MNYLISKKYKGFTLIEVTCYMVILSFIMISTFSFHFYYKKRVNSSLKEVSNLRKIEKFVNVIKRSVDDIRSNSPEAKVECSEGQLFFSTKEGKDFLFKFSDSNLFYSLERADIKERSFKCMLQKVDFSLISKKENKKETVKDIQAITADFKIEDGYVISYVISMM
ncbi:MAG: prepilin-type N-terminal cleavage/methylation domain-containing protein [Candidatus Aureabacteria bacterium]|nr:prepilin-type N-terminal cleavage/methylation domain-containing protein [Candidatus Auribacterota bacterium]